MKELALYKMNKNIVYNWQEVISSLSIDGRWQDVEQYLTPTEKLHGINIHQLWKVLDRTWDDLEENNVISGNFIGIKMGDVNGSAQGN